MDYELLKYIDFVDKHNEIFINKIQKSYNIWINKNSHLELEYEKLQNFLIVLKHRHLSTLYHLEVLWKQKEFSSDVVKVQSSQFNQLSLMHFESFFIQARSMIETTQKFSLIYLNVKDSFKDLKEFFKRIKKSENEIKLEIYNFYKNEVFAEGKYGNRIKSFRDKIIHGSMIHQNNYLDPFKNILPLIGYKSYEEFNQQTHNETFEFLVK